MILLVLFHLALYFGVFRVAETWSISAYITCLHGYIHTTLIYLWGSGRWGWSSRLSLLGRIAFGVFCGVLVLLALPIFVNLFSFVFDFHLSHFLIHTGLGKKEKDKKPRKKESGSSMSRDIHPCCFTGGTWARALQRFVPFSPDILCKPGQKLRRKAK